MEGEIDAITLRPRCKNIPYSYMSDEQIRNVKKKCDPFFFRPVPASKTTGRRYMDRYAKVTSQHLVRGFSRTQPFEYIDYQFQQEPAEEFNTCRDRASVRWGPNKSGERTRSHYFGEPIDRYTTIDMYRRNPTTFPGPVLMDYGRPVDGYYAPKNPLRSTWFHSTVPLNRTGILDHIYPKTTAQYEGQRVTERALREARTGRWPEFSDYTAKHLLQIPTPPSNLITQMKKKEPLVTT